MIDLSLFLIDGASRERDIAERPLDPSILFPCPIMPMVSVARLTFPTQLARSVASSIEKFPYLIDRGRFVNDVHTIRNLHTVFDRVAKVFGSMNYPHFND